MHRRTLLSASLGLASLGGLAYWGSRASALPELTAHTGGGRAFGTTVSIRVLHDDPRTAQAAIAEALRHIRQVDALMSLHQPHSQVYQLNAT